MNKFHLITTVLTSTLKADDKNLLIELIVRTNYEEHGNWDCWPSVERLAQVRGMKNERHFKGVDVYLPGLVTKRKNGRKNVYTVNVEAVMALPAFEVTLKHTPAIAVNTPAVEVNTPAVAADTPSVAGANSTSNTTKNTKEESTKTVTAVADAPAVPQPPLSSIDTKEEPVLPIEGTSLSPNDSGRNPGAVPAPYGGPIREQALNREETVMLNEEQREAVTAVVSRRQKNEWTDEDRAVWDDVLTLALDESFSPYTTDAETRVRRAKRELTTGLRVAVPA